MHTQTASESAQQASWAAVLNDLVQVLANPGQTFNWDRLEALGLSSESAKQLGQIKQMVVNIQVKQQQYLEDSQRDTFVTIAKIKEGLNNAIVSSGRIQAWTAAMYLATFFLGFALVIAGALLAKSGETDWFTLTFGASGFALILATLVSRPPRELQRVRSNYVQLSVLALSWFNELVDNSSARSSFLNGKIDEQALASFEKLAISQGEVTRQHLAWMERYAEPNEKLDLHHLAAAAKTPQG